MQVLFIIGNGFDINLGMKTKYSDFYQYYKSQECNSEIITNLKNTIDENYENWADLELEFGKYTKRINSLSEFDLIYNDICDNLAVYIEDEESKLDFSTFNVEKLKDYLCSPEKGLPQADKNSISEYKQTCKVGLCNVDVMTFNYTRTIERILQNDPALKESQQNVIGLQQNNHKVLLRSINHIHGYHDDSMVMGVNDISQIENSIFCKNPDILESMVKIECNKSLKHTVDNRCTKLISNADIICVFGSSIGLTDRYWWNCIGKELLNNKRLIIYTRSEEILRRRARMNGRKVRGTKELFFEKTSLKPEEIEKVKDYVFVGVNSDMFNLK